MRSKAFLTLIAISVFSLSSCIKENNNQGGTVVTYSQKQVGVLCEGNYLWNNARFDVYSLDSERYYPNVFEAANKMPVGDVLHSGQFSGKYIWLCVNNTGKIMALDRKTMKVVKSRGGLKSPRNILPIGEYILVSDLMHNAVSVLDSGSLNTIHEFKVNLGTLTSNRSGWTEQLIEWNGEAVAACYDGYLMFMNPKSKTSTKIEADTGCQNLVVDANNQLWVLSSVNGVASLVAYGSDKKEIKRFAFSAGSTVSRLCLSPQLNELYFIHQNKVCKLGINAQSLSQLDIIYTGAQTCYGLGVDPRTGNIFVADAKDYVSNGAMIVLNADKEILKIYPTGIIPGGFVFF